MLVLPNMYADFVMYNSGKPVVWGGHSGNLARLEEFFPVIRRPLTYFFERYHVAYVLLDLQYTTLDRLQIGDATELLEQFGSIGVYQVRTRASHRGRGRHAARSWPEVADALAGSLDSAPPPRPHGRAADRRVFATAGAIVALSLVVKAGTAVRELLDRLVLRHQRSARRLPDRLRRALLLDHAVRRVARAGAGARVCGPAGAQPAPRCRDAGRRHHIVSTTAAGGGDLGLAAGAPLYLQLIGAGFSPEKLALAERLAAVLAPTVLTSVLISLAGGILNAHNRFLAPGPVAADQTTASRRRRAVRLRRQLGRVRAGIRTADRDRARIVVAATLVRREVAPRISHTLANPQLVDLGARFVPTLIGALLMASTLLVDQAMSQHIARRAASPPSTTPIDW